MDNKTKIHIFAHSDLDGASCCLLFQWYLWNIPTYTLTNHENLNSNVSKWLLKNKIEDYDKIYFVGLDTCSILKNIDYANVHIFDHHQEAKRCKDLYKNAKVDILEYGSTVLGLYRILKEKLNDRKISAPQRKFVALVDDYISYRLLEKDISVGLNMIFWNYQGDKVKKLKEEFNDGFFEFTPQQIKIIDFYKSKIKKIIDSADFYVVDFKIQGVFRKVIATFADTCVNEVASELTEMGFEVAIIVNTATNKVSFRRNHRSNIDLDKLAKNLTEGGGYKNTAGGLITEKFMNFTKLLEKYDIGKGN
jgi:oligoribonuclease NrnB/cAMP/cGMP phosphodiesterase (DHH superfamily)